MTLFRFIFAFLYTRNWHTGHMELSIPRVVLFLGMLSLIIIGSIIAYVLQMPVGYSAL